MKTKKTKQSSNSSPFGSMERGQKQDFSAFTGNVVQSHSKVKPKKKKNVQKIKSKFILTSKKKSHIPIVPDYPTPENELNARAKRLHELRQEAEIARTKASAIAVVDVSPEDQELFTEKTESASLKIRDFLLKELAPKQIAGQIASDTVMQELNILLESSVSSSMAAASKRIADEISILKFASFMCDLYELPDSIKAQYIETKLEAMKPTTGGKPATITAEPPKSERKNNTIAARQVRPDQPKRS